MIKQNCVAGTESTFYLFSTDTQLHPLLSCVSWQLIKKRNHGKQFLMKFFLIVYEAIRALTKKIKLKKKKTYKNAVKQFEYF